MENTLSQIPNILQAGKLFTTFPTGTQFPMIATRDIGVRAAELLLNRDWSGNRIVELHGAAETGYDEVAVILTEVLKKDIKHITVSDEQLIGALTGMGISKVLSEALAELIDGIAQGRVHYLKPRDAANTTTTTYREFANEVFKPAFEAARAAA